MSETNLDDMLDAESTDSDDIDLGDLGDFGEGDETNAAGGDEGGGGLEDLAGDLGDLGGGDEMEAGGGDEGGGLEDLAGDLGDLGGGDEMEAGGGDEGGGFDDLAGALGGMGGGEETSGEGEQAGGRDVVAVSRAQLSSNEAVNLDFLLDVKLDVTFEVGRAKMVISDLLTLGQGSVVELHRLVGEELDIMVNGKLIAKGEVVVVNEKFGCRISEIVSPVDRVKHLSGY